MSYFRKDHPGQTGSDQPASKLSLLTSHRQAASGAGISIRFNASSSFDDDDMGEGITVVTEAPIITTTASLSTRSSAEVAVESSSNSVAVNNSSSSGTTNYGGTPVSSTRNSTDIRRSYPSSTTTQAVGTNAEQLQNGRGHGSQTGGSQGQDRRPQLETRAGGGGVNSVRTTTTTATSKLPTTGDMDRHSPGGSAGSGASEDKAQPKNKDHSRIYSRPQEGEEKVSILSGIRGRLQDKFHDNLTAVIGKIEEISGDSKLGEAIERRLKKGDSFDSSRNTTGHQYRSTNGVGTSVTRRSESVKKSRGDHENQSRSRHDSGGNSSVSNSHTTNITSGSSEAVNTCDGNVAGFVRSSNSAEVLGGILSSPSTGSLSGVKGKDETLSQEEEVFSTEGISVGGEDRVRQVPRRQQQQQQRPSSTSGVETTSTTGDTSRLAMKGWKQKDVKQSSLESSQSVPVSMSALLSHPDTDLEGEGEEEVGIECDQEFFDLQEEQAKKSASKESVSDNGDPETTTVDKAPTPSEQTSPGRKLKLPFNISLTRSNVLSISVALVAILVLPLPSFVSGILIGGFLGACSLSVFQWVTEPIKQKESIQIPDIRKMPPLRVPYMKESKNLDGKFKGWMNELSTYDQSTYHISNTKSVYIQLEGTDLRLQTPKQGIPKRALWTEPKVFPTSFIKQRFLNLTDCSVSLLPEGLVSKRIWSKKYPICIIPHSKKDPKKKAENSPGSSDLEEAKHLGFDSLSSDQGSRSGGVYLFARTCREKEEWFHRLVAASRNKPLFTRLSDMINKANSHCMMHKSGQNVAKLTSMESTTTSRRGQLQQLQQLSPSHPTHQHLQRRGSSDSSHSETFSNIEIETMDNSEKVSMEYLKYMTQVMPDTGPKGAGSKKKTTTKKNSYKNRDKLVKKTGEEGEEGGEEGFVSLTNRVDCDPTVLWTNALLGRLFFDFLREQYWADKVRAKIQGKLSKIHVPYFIDKLTVTGIELGSQVPVIQRISRPYLDERGIWFDLDLVYSGGFSMTLETKVNLMKLKKTTDGLEKKQETVVMETHKASAVTDSGEEDSAESSTDEEAEEEYTEDRLVQAEPARKKLLKIVDKIAASKYFQQATENKYIKKAMEGVSNTRLVLSVEMRSCVGTMVLNIPPPPTDRIWYGFRHNPTLVLSAKPRVGQREVSVAHIVEWIENKLALEFQRVLVMPNMDDLEVPLMCGHLTDQDREDLSMDQQQQQADAMDSSLFSDPDLD